VEALSSRPVRCAHASANQRDGHGFVASASRHKGTFAEQGAQQENRLLRSRISSLKGRSRRGPGGSDPVQLSRSESDCPKWELAQISAAVCITSCRCNLTRRPNLVPSDTPYVFIFDHRHRNPPPLSPQRWPFLSPHASSQRS
jgi:hypothetical protein